MRAFGSLLLFCGAAFAQSDAAPKFIVADVHASPHAAIPATKGPFFGDGRYEIHYATMVDLIHAAYDVDPDRVYGGPSWLEYDRYDVLAMAPPNSNAESRKLMLQSLLADRFGLTLHKDSKPMTAYVLKAGPNSKLQESTGSGGSCNMKIENMPPPGPPPTGEDRPPIHLPVFVYTCQGVSMAKLADTVAGAPTANQIFNNKPVVDMTELKGTYDFTFRFTPKVPPNFKVTGEPISITDAMEKQLGLKLELSTAPMPVIAVDSANETPSANSPDVAKAFPPVPTEFDAAEIKPSDSKRDNVMPEIKNGRVLLPGIDLKSLVLIAWDFSPNDDNALVGAPKWLNSARYDIIAKAPAGVALGDLTPSSQKSFPINLDALRPMLKNLLVERFKMQVHTEERPMNVYTLLAVKPKMQKADPVTRTKWVNGALGDQKETRSSNPALGRYVSCQNMSMAQFAKLLQEIAPGYVHNEVVDATGLDGGWTFTLNFSGIGQLQGGGGRGDGGGAASAGPADSGASDPSGALSLPDAIQKQLGLKLEQQKRPMTVLVIDHIEEKPTDN